MKLILIIFLSWVVPGFSHPHVFVDVETAITKYSNLNATLFSRLQRENNVGQPRSSGHPC
jgi:ABC-type uncharacterized transport system substrate-binding protein